MKKQKENFKFTKKHFTICAVIFALLSLVIYGTYIQPRDRNLKNANKAVPDQENISSSHYHWPDEKLARTNSWTYSDPDGKFTATTTYQAKDTSTIHLKRVTKNKKTGKEVTEYGALVMPDISHSQEVFSVINTFGKTDSGTKQSIYTCYGTSVKKTASSITKMSDQDGTRFLFWSDKPKGDFKFVGIVTMSRIQPSAVDDVDTLEGNIAYSFEAHEVIKVKEATQYATWAYVDALLHFERPDDNHKLTTTKLVLAMNNENPSSIKIAQRLGFTQGTDADNENMDIYVLTTGESQIPKYNQESSSPKHIEEVRGAGIVGVLVRGIVGVLVKGVVGEVIGAGIGLVLGVFRGGIIGGIIGVIVGLVVGVVVGVVVIGEVGRRKVILVLVGGVIGGVIGAGIGAKTAIKFYLYDDPNLDQADPA